MYTHATEIWGFQISYKYNDEIYSIRAVSPDFTFEIVTRLEKIDQLEIKTTENADFSYTGDGSEDVLRKSYIRNDYSNYVSLSDVAERIISRVVGRRDDDLEDDAHSEAEEFSHIAYQSSIEMTGGI